MSDRPRRLRGHLYRATAIVPLALVSAAWTVSMVSSSPASLVSSADALRPTPLPDGTSVPTQAITVPATVSTPTQVAPGLSTANARQIVDTSTAAGIPAAALAAYQRAETVIDSADKTCKLPWQLVAAIGRVESNHGRANGNVLDSHGVAHPGIYGLALDGTHGTTLVADTDAGQYDNDLTYDRAVGPMQFIPSTWSVVGVDADGDGKRDPQDINDAALATAVYLCSGNDDLSTDAGQRASVFRYNHSASYVDLVLSIEQQYLAGDFTSVPTNTLASGVFSPIPIQPGSVTVGGHHNGGGHHVITTAPGSTVSTAPTATATPTTTPTSAPTHSGGGHHTPTPTPTHSPTHGGGGTGIPGLPTHAPTLPPLPTTSVPPVDHVLTVAQAIVQCTLDGLVDNPLTDTDKFDQCVTMLTTPKPPKP